MQIKQISVFLENNPGRLGVVTRALADAGINIRAISIADTKEYGIARFIVDKNETAVKALTAAGFTTRLTDVVAVEVADCPGALAKVMELFQKSNVNIEYLYASLEGKVGKAVIIFKMENLDVGLKIVQDNGLSMVEAF
jgi:hypothetical protein